VLLRGDAKLVVESMVPNLLHIVPVGNDAVLDRLLHSQNTALLLSLRAHVDLLLVEANHDARHLGSAYDGAEN
jgi:hypothetical protein